MKMKADIVMGAFFGDEGKGKIADFISKIYDADYAVRATGGANAGHTIVKNGKKCVFHLLPCGMASGAVGVICRGTFLDLPLLAKEIDMLRDVMGIKAKLRIDERAHIVLNFHKLLDKKEEEVRKECNMEIGTTKSGIGPAAQAKSRRSGIRVGDLVHALREGCMEELRRKLLLELSLSGSDTHDLPHILSDLKEAGMKILPYVVPDTSIILHDAMDNWERVVIEGAQAAMLDADAGYYPYCTSSSPSIGGILSGTGLSHRDIGEVYGVIKPYTSKVGNGPFPTQISGSMESRIRELGHEYGATTGRPRNIGWLDLPMLRYTARENGFTALVLNHLDTIGNLDEIEVCMGYKDADSGELCSDFSTGLCMNKKPVYEKISCGWDKDAVSKCREFCDLPQSAKEFIRFIETNTGLPIRYIGCGPDRDDVIIR